MTNCTNVTMWFVSYKFFFRHYFFSSLFKFNFIFLERVKGIEPLHPAWKASVLPLNYTRTTPRVTLQYYLKFIDWWRGKDSNFRRPKSTGLQPAPFDRSGTPPLGEVSPCSIKLQTTCVLYILFIQMQLVIY